MKHNRHAIWLINLVAFIVLLSTANGVDAQDRPLLSNEDQEQTRTAPSEITWAGRNLDISALKLKNALHPSPPQLNIANGNSLVNSSVDQHVFFIGTDQLVYNYWWTGSKWQLNALDYSAPKIAAGNLVASADHVFFIGTDKLVYNYWWDGSKWHLNALDYNAPKIAAGNLVLSPSADHVFFIGTDKLVYNYWWDGSKWHLNALDYNAPKIAAGNLVVSSSGDHVFFIGTDKLVYNHWWTGSKWQLNALDYSAPKIAAGNLVVK